jgi:ABC-type branched-subunit amino acid transport system substrate-binding protein
MEQFGGLVGLARDDASEKAIAYKATNIYGETCYFGVKSTAQAWAKSGSVDEVRLRDLKVVAAQTPAEAPADVARDAERLDWLLRNLPGDALRYCVGVLSDTSDGKEFRDAIDAAIERQGGQVE